MATVNLDPSKESRRIVEGTPKKEKTEKVVEGGVKRKKDSALSIFLKDHMKAIGKYVVEDFIIPTAKDALVSCVEIAVYGERRRRRGGSSSGPYRDYTGFSKPNKPQMSRADRASHNFDNIYFDRHEDADKVLDSLLYLIEQYGNAAVADFYDLVGEEQTHVDTQFGWVDLREARVRRTRDGWIVDLPRPYSIE